MIILYFWLSGFQKWFSPMCHELKWNEYLRVSICWLKVAQLLEAKSQGLSSRDNFASYNNYLMNNSLTRNDMIRINSMIYVKFTRDFFYSLCFTWIYGTFNASKIHVDTLRDQDFEGSSPDSCFFLPLY